jgi:hypothetical protein
MFIFMLLLYTGITTHAHATTYFPFIEEHRQLKEKALMRTGTFIFLFHSGTPEITKAIRVNDVLPVYREDESCALKKIGAIKVLSRTGGHYIKAEVIEGTLRLNDIAKKDGTAFLVIVLDEPCAQ